LPTILGGAIGGAAGSLVIKRYNFKKESIWIEGFLRWSRIFSIISYNGTVGFESDNANPNSFERNKWTGKKKYEFKYSKLKGKSKVAPYQIFPDNPNKLGIFSKTFENFEFYASQINYHG
ncbi:hypothetical protein LCGC14_2578600, partial [marine sediment metagenome]